MRLYIHSAILAVLLLCSANAGRAQQAAKLVVAPSGPVGKGWSVNSVNTVPFRKNALVTDGNEQFIAYYDTLGRVVVGKRKLTTTNWQLHATPFSGNASDAHNCICIMTDGAGYLHIAWDHHNNALHYAVSTEPHGLDFGAPKAMTGQHEDKVTYPEFYRMANGNLLFQYRDGGSGNGNLVLNSYNVKARVWQQLQHNLIDGEGQRNAYCQTTVDPSGTIHISWVWRETPDVASNHDMCYARSRDGGQTWEKSTGEKYSLPINAANAEYVARIPQGSDLMNQTAMYVGEDSMPVIATYWREAADSTPQYHIIYRQSGSWQTINAGFRKVHFRLGGLGTRNIPMSRPQVVSYTDKGQRWVALLFRDAERNSKVSIALHNLLAPANNWTVKDLSATSVDAWEPNYDTELWKQQKILSLFVQQVAQTNGEGQARMPAQMITTLRWMP